MLFLLILSTTATSCEYGLDLSPKDQVSDASFWKTSADFKMAANDFYFGLQEIAQYIDNNSDIAFGGSPDNVSNGSFLVQANDPIWNQSYAYIRSTNYLLLKAEESALGNEIDRWIGEAFFFRAYNYWNLVKRFGNVPLITKVLDVTSPELYSPNSTQKETIDLILSDLDKAISKLPLQSELAGDEIGRVTKGAAQALKARVALYQGTWSKYRNENGFDTYLDQAIDATNQVISSNEYDLYKEKGKDSYKYLFILEGDDSKEVILARRYYIQRITHNWTRELWFNAMVPTKNLADMYLDSSGLPIEKSILFKGYGTLTSEFQNRDPRMAMTFIVPGSTIFFEGGINQPTFPGFIGTNATLTGYMLRKFLGENLDAAQFRGDYDFKEFRYSEILLILAEALYEKNGVISDNDLNRTINQLRLRVNMPYLTNSFVTENGLDLKEEIRRERTIELAFEGFRRDDLRRWKTAETILPLPLKGIKFLGTEYQTKYPDVVAAGNITFDSEGFIVADPASGRSFSSSKHYLFPIPSQQIQLSNGTLKQNEGW